MGDRGGIAWLRHTCGRCAYCLHKIFRVVAPGGAKFVGSGRHMRIVPATANVAPPAGMDFTQAPAAADFVDAFEEGGREP